MLDVDALRLGGILQQPQQSRVRHERAIHKRHGGTIARRVTGVSSASGGWGRSSQMVPSSAIAASGSTR